MALSTSSSDEEVENNDEKLSLCHLFEELQNTQKGIQRFRTDSQNIQQQLKHLAKKMSNISSLILSVILRFLFLKETC